MKGLSEGTQMHHWEVMKEYNPPWSDDSKSGHHDRISDTLGTKQSYHGCLQCGRKSCQELPKVGGAGGVDAEVEFGAVENKMRFIVA